LLALSLFTDGARESAQDWGDLLLDFGGASAATTSCQN
jgi:hypothetical protein